MAKRQTLEQVEAQRAFVLREFALGHIKKRQANQLKKQYDDKILKLRRELRK